MFGNKLYEMMQSLVFFFFRCAVNSIVIHQHFVVSTQVHIHTCAVQIRWRWWLFFLHQSVTLSQSWWTHCVQSCHTVETKIDPHTSVNRL